MPVAKIQQRIAGDHHVIFCILTYGQNLRHPDENIARIEKQRELALCHRNAFVHGVVDTVIWLADKA